MIDVRNLRFSKTLLLPAVSSLILILINCVAVVGGLILFLSACSQSAETRKTPDVPPFVPADRNPNNYDEIGFACGEAGAPTSIVEEFEKLIKDKDYKTLRAKLYSQKTGDMVVATLACERLHFEGEFRLSKMELVHMDDNRAKKDSVYTCSGCGDFRIFSIHDVLSDEKNYINQEAHWWMDELLGKNIVSE